MLVRHSRHSIEGIHGQKLLRGQPRDMNMSSHRFYHLVMYVHCDPSIQIGYVRSLKIVVPRTLACF